MIIESCSHIKFLCSDGITYINMCLAAKIHKTYAKICTHTILDTCTLHCKVDCTGVGSMCVCVCVCVCACACVRACVRACVYNKYVQK